MATLKQGTTLAKKLRKANPKLSWIDAVKKAHEQLNKGTKKVAGYVKTIRQGSKTDVIYSKQIKEKKEKKPVQQKLFGVKSFSIGELFDTQAILDLDTLKKQYFNLAKKYHPDAGGTTSQFQQLQKEYETLLRKILSGSNLNKEQKENEIEIDQAVREIINSLINIEGITVEVIGKWLWIGGDTYPVRSTLKSAGLTFIKKAGTPYWVYKGVESKGRGKMSIEEIKAKYGVHKFETPKTKKISGLVSVNRTRLKHSLEKLKRGLNKRPI